MEFINPAQRIENVKEYFFSIKSREIAKMNREGVEVINLGIGSPDLPPSEATIDALRKDALLPNAHGYQPYIGIPELRQEFANWYKRHYDVTLNPENEIIPLMGSKEGIMHISMTFVNPGDGVLIPNPGYPTYTSVSRMVGANIIPFPLRPENNWEPDFDELERMDRAGEISLDKVKLMWCNYPNMPTGAKGSRELFKKLVDFGQRHRIVIVHDNPYSFILNDEPKSILSVPGAKECCIEMNSLSKAFNMPGWRVGMAASNETFLKWILRVKSNMDSGTFRPIQKAAVEALKAPDSWYKKNNEIYTRRSRLAMEIMHSIGAEAREGQAGLFLWGKIEGDCMALSDRILHEHRVFITPGSIFGSEGDHYVRISLCRSEEMLKEALHRINK